MRNTLATWLGIACISLSACSSTQSVSFSTVPLGGGAVPVYLHGQLTKPEGAGPFPAVVLLHSCGGMMSHVRTFWPNELKSAGYVVLSIDSFGSRGLPRCPNRIMSRSEIHLAWMTGDAYGGLDYLASLPFVDPGRVAVIGFSLGAYVVNLDMTPRNMRSPEQRQFKAAIGFYGVCASGPALGPGLSALVESPYPMLELIPALDEKSVETCAPLTQPWIEKHILPRASHAFDFPENQMAMTSVMGSRISYSAEATRESSVLVREFLARTLR